MIQLFHRLILGAQKRGLKKNKFPTVKHEYIRTLSFSLVKEYPYSTNTHNEMQGIDYFTLKTLSKKFIKKERKLMATKRSPEVGEITKHHKQIHKEYQ